MDPSIAAHNADWMIPALIAAMSVASSLVVGLIIWIVHKAVGLALQFRKDVMARLDAQDKDQAQIHTVLGAIKDLLQDEVHKLRERLWTHDTRISRLEEHNGLPPMRRKSDDA